MTAGGGGGEEGDGREDLRVPVFNVVDSSDIPG